MRNVIALAAAGVVLAACATPSSREPITAAPTLTDQQAFAAARSAVLATLKDADSAKFGGAFTRKTVAMRNPVFALRAVPVDQRTDIVCGTVNSKNTFGAYVGQAVFAYRVDRHDVFLDGVGERLGSIWCVDSEQAS